MSADASVPKTKESVNDFRRETGLPGGGKGRRDEVGGSGVYPMSGPHPAGNAPIIPEPAWGQGERGAAGYDEAGESELIIEQVVPEKCRDVMTKDPVCCLASDTVDAVARLMEAHDVGAIPVVESQESKKLQGIVTDRDLALRVVAQGRDPRATRVEDVMTRTVVGCGPDADIEQALDEMERYQVRRIAIVDNSGRIVGIIAQADVALRIRKPEKTAEVVEEISKPKLKAA